MYPTVVKTKYIDLRKKGFSLNKLVEVSSIPKTTVYYWIKDIPLSEESREKFIKNSLRNLRKGTEARRGRCNKGRIVIKPKGWEKELIFLTAHFMFDGEIQTHSCIYHNRNEFLINRVRSLMKEVFNLQPHNLLNKETGVYRISYHYVELAEYMRGKTQGLKKYISTAALPKKKIFLRSFFDDEGCVSWHRKKRRVRGYQKDLEILKLIKGLLKNFNIESKIDKKYKEIVISRKENLIEFRDKINFSKGVYINPDRKNSIWKKKLEKREILDRIISSYEE